MAEKDQALVWRKSRFCGNASCVEIAFDADAVFIRDSKNPAAAALQFALGLSTLLLVVPIPLAAAHQAGAVLLLTAAIVFRHALRRAA